MPLFGLPKGRGAYSETKNMPEKACVLSGRDRVAKYPAKICFVLSGKVTTASVTRKGNSRKARSFAAHYPRSAPGSGVAFFGRSSWGREGCGERGSFFTRKSSLSPQTHSPCKFIVPSRLRPCKLMISARLRPGGRNRRGRGVRRGRRGRARGRRGRSSRRLWDNRRTRDS